MKADDADEVALDPDAPIVERATDDDDDSDADFDGAEPSDDEA